MSSDKFQVNVFRNSEVSNISKLGDILDISTDFYTQNNKCKFDIQATDTLISTFKEIIPDGTIQSSNVSNKKITLIAIVED